MINTLHSLQQHLQVNAGETNLALNRGQRHYDAQEKAQGYLLVCNYFQSGYIVLYIHVWQEFGPTHSDYDCCRYGLCYYVDKGSHLWLLHETAVSSHTHTHSLTGPSVFLRPHYTWAAGPSNGTDISTPPWNRLAWSWTHDAGTINLACVDSCPLWIMHTAQVCATVGIIVTLVAVSSIWLVPECNYWGRKHGRSHHMWWCYVMVDTWKWCSTNNLEGSCL